LEICVANGIVTVSEPVTDRQRRDAEAMARSVKPFAAQFMGHAGQTFRAIHACS